MIFTYESYSGQFSRGGHDNQHRYCAGSQPPSLSAAESHAKASVYLGSF